MKHSLLIAAVSAIALGTAAHAQTFSDRTAFNAAAGPVTTETFEGCGTSTTSLGGNQSLSAAAPGPCSAIAPGITFSPDQGFDLYIAGPGQSANTTTALGVDLPSAGHNNISFAGTVTAFGADFNQNFGGGSQSGNPTDFLIETFLGGSAVSSFTFSVPSGQSSFFGLISSAFDSLRVSQVGSGFAVLDNVSFGGAGAVPELATWAMMTLGIGFAGATLRRRRASMATA